jgi:succinate dehydrogenase / fumarate reductase cytochrome b subunit
MNLALPLALYRSSIGQKAVMAVTGAIGVGYAALHMYGNLKVFAGREHFNAYAAFIRSVGEPLFPHTGVLWIIRIVVLVSVLLHIASAVSLARQAQAARPLAYLRQPEWHTSYASRTMRWGGLVLVLFLCYHVLHITFGTLHPHFERHDPYQNVVVGFQFWAASLLYLAAMGAFGLHLYHGAWSLFQTLGLTSGRVNRALRPGAALLALLLAGGYGVVPLAVVLGIVR